MEWSGTYDIDATGSKTWMIKNKKIIPRKTFVFMNDERRTKNNAEVWKYFRRIQRFSITQQSKKDFPLINQCASTMTYCQFMNTKLDPAKFNYRFIFCGNIQLSIESITIPIHLLNSMAIFKKIHEHNAKVPFLV